MEIEWSRAGFERLGFVGWKPFGELEKDDLSVDPGVYVVTTPPAPRPTFLAESVGGMHKRRPLTADTGTLEAARRDGAEVLYVGKAGGALGLQMSSTPSRRPSTRSSLFASMNATTSGSGGRAPPEEGRRTLEHLVGAAKLPVLLLKLLKASTRAQRTKEPRKHADPGF